MLRVETICICYVEKTRVRVITSVCRILVPVEYFGGLLMLTRFFLSQFGAQRREYRVEL